MQTYKYAQKTLLKNPKTWLITGVAGFIGSNLLEMLLQLNQRVVGLDNFSTGRKENLSEVQLSVSKKQWSKFHFIRGDISNFKTCQIACKNIDYVLHQAALGSVPRSIKYPIKTNKSNISGFLNILQAAKEADVENFVYAASSSTYGDHTKLPKREHIIGKPLSPYAVTKYVNELYADVYKKSYNFNSIGLRYFNVFGKRQTPNSAYAAVIPKWVDAMVKNKQIFINGDGSTSRDFCFIENAIQANILAATEASKKKSYESILVKGNKITEAAHSNVWIVRGKKIITHPANKEILKGVTRTVLKSIIKSLNLQLIEKEFSIKELLKSEEVFITSSGSLVTPIIQVDKIKINKGKIGAITKSLALNLYKAIT